MITTEGKLHIKRYMAGYVPAIARSFAMGTGTTAELVGDRSLAFETINTSIALTSYDFVNDKLIFKAGIPDDYIGKIYEVGLYSLESDPVGGQYGSRVISTFDSGSERWIDPATGILSPYTTLPIDDAGAVHRVGLDALLHTPALSATQTSALQDAGLDFSENSAADEFIFSLNVANTNTASVEYRFMTDASNYYRFVITTPVTTAGYKIITAAKSTATVVGSPNWNNVSEIRVLTTSKATGASSVAHDAIRMEDRDYSNLDYILVARKVLATPITKIAGKAQDVEFSLDINL